MAIRRENQRRRLRQRIGPIHKSAFGIFKPEFFHGFVVFGEEIRTDDCLASSSRPCRQTLIWGARRKLALGTTLVSKTTLTI